MQIELLVVLVIVAVLLGLAVGVKVREIAEQRRRDLEAQQASLRGRVKAGIRKGTGRVTKEAARASRRGVLWAWRRRFRRDRDSSEE